MNAFFKMNGKRITRAHVEKYWQSGNTVTVTLVSGATEVKEYASEDLVAKALAVLDNLTIMDDVDGL